MQRQLHMERRTWEEQLAKGTQEAGRLRLYLDQAAARLAALRARTAATRAAAHAIVQAAPHVSTSFGPFASATGVSACVQRLGLDAETLHGLSAEARRFAMLQIGSHFEQLRALTRMLRSLASRSVEAFETLDLSDTIDCINKIVAQSTAATQVHADAAALLCAAALRTARLHCDTMLLCCGQAVVMASGAAPVVREVSVYTAIMCRFLVLGVHTHGARAGESLATGRWWSPLVVPSAITDRCAKLPLVHAARLSAAGGLSILLSVSHSLSAASATRAVPRCTCAPEALSAAAYHSTTFSLLKACLLGWAELAAPLIHAPLQAADAQSPLC